MVKHQITNQYVGDGQVCDEHVSNALHGLVPKHHRRYEHIARDAQREYDTVHNYEDGAQRRIAHDVSQVRTVIASGLVVL